MRTQDDEKKQALFEATVKLVNEIGFAASSVSKIAAEAKVSPSTIYVYYKNKEDLLVSTYVSIKRSLSIAILEDFDDTLPIRDTVRKVWLRIFEYITDNSECYTYCEQFANSPYSSLVDKESLERYFVPILEVLQRGVQQKIIKDVDRRFLTAFTFHPISFLANPRLCQDIEMNPENMETAFTMVWDAIKL